MTTSGETPKLTLRELVHGGITHVIGIPDNTSGALFGAVLRHATIRLITVAREGEAFAIASGLWLGGASPLVVVQNTGLLESGDSLRGTAVRMGVPLPIVVTWRGFGKMVRAGVNPTDERTPGLLKRADVDSVALLTEPTLAAWGVPYRTCTGEEDPVDALRATMSDALDQERPVALLLGRSFT